MAQTKVNTADHSAVGAYSGKAMDGRFVADDSTTLLGAPFGPHTTAVGTWTPTSNTEFTAEYIFMANAFPPPKDGVSVSGLRARWLATVIDADTVVGWVNADFLSPAVGAEPLLDHRGGVH